MKIYEVKFSRSLELETGNLLDEFSFPWVDRESPRTEFRAVWNDGTFRFRFDAIDDDIVLNKSEDKNAAVLGSDRVELFFASDSELKEFYYGMEMDPRGWAYDYRAKSYRQIDDEWNFPTLEMEGEVNRAGYSLEGSIDMEAFESLGLIKDNTMIAGVYRAEFFHGPDGVVEDWMPWVDPGTEAPDFHVPSSFGRFSFVR